MNYLDAFIAVADDCPTEKGLIPTERSGKKTVASIQYDLLAGHPYQHTQEDVLFLTHVRHKGTPAAALEAHGDQMREDFFAKEQPCLRASPLPRRYGWGFHFDPDGKVAVYPVESRDYKRLASRASKVLKALRASRV